MAVKRWVAAASAAALAASVWVGSADAGAIWSIAGTVSLQPNAYTDVWLGSLPSLPNGYYSYEAQASFLLYTDVQWYDEIDYEDYSENGTWIGGDNFNIWTVSPVGSFGAPHGLFYTENRTEIFDYPNGALEEIRYEWPAINTLDLYFFNSTPNQQVANFVFSIDAVPEPATWVMAISGLFLVGVLMRRRGHGGGLDIIQRFSGLPG